MIEEYTEEIKLAGGIGCFEKGMPLQSRSPIGNDQKESDFGYSIPSTDKQWKGENRADIEYPIDNRQNSDKVKRHDEYDSGSSQRQQSHRSYKHSDRRDDKLRDRRKDKHNDRRDDEFTRTKRHSIEGESYHQNYRSSREKSSSDYKTKRDDPYDRRSQQPRNQNLFEDRYIPTEKE